MTMTFFQRRDHFVQHLILLSFTRYHVANLCGISKRNIRIKRGKPIYVVIATDFMTCRKFDWKFFYFQVSSKTCFCDQNHLELYIYIIHLLKIWNIMTIIHLTLAHFSAKLRRGRTITGNGILNFWRWFSRL